MQSLSSRRKAKSVRGEPKPEDRARDELLVELGALRTEVEALRGRNAELIAGTASANKIGLGVAGGLVAISVLVTLVVAPPGPPDGAPVASAAASSIAGPAPTTTVSSWT